MANLLPGENVFWTVDPTFELPLRISNDPKSPASKAPFTVIEAFKKTVKQYPRQTAMKIKRDGKWLKWSYSRYFKQCRQFGAALVKVGLQPFQGVAIIGFNSPEWFIADFGTIFAGGIVGGIYTTNGPEACHYVADHCEARVIVVENEIHLNKFLQVLDRLPNVQCIVQYTGEPPKDTPVKVYGWKEFLDLGKGVEQKAEVDRRMSAQKPGNCCTLIYTSGTTGSPKAVMLSHDNLTWTASVCSDIFGVKTADEVAVSYLPLSHIAAQMMDVHAPMMKAGTVVFADPSALRGSLVVTLQEARPTLMMGVPRVWEKIEEKMKDIGRQNTGVKKMIGDWAKDVGLRGSYAKIKGDSLPWGWWLADTMVYSKVRANLGLDRCRVKLTGAAPIKMQTLEYFMSLDMGLLEMYGLSETAGPQTVNLPGVGNNRVGTVGRSLPGIETKISSVGEICCRGRNTFMGYMKNKKSTSKDFDDEGFFHTGDLGKMSDGFLSITGRIKELIITAGGENVPPVLIEDKIKTEMPGISNAMVVGDRKKYLACLISLKTEPDEAGDPTDVLTPAALEMLAAAGSKAKNLKEALADPLIYDFIDAGIAAVNETATSRAQRVSKWAFLEKDFSISEGDLTPTMKLKRSKVTTKYESLINKVYNDEIVRPTGIRAKL